MTPQNFDKLVERRVELIKSVLKSKAGEYASSKDRLHNFQRAANMLGVTREKALVGMWAKHIVSVLDIVDGFDIKKPTEELINEKIGDSICYLVLLEAILKEDSEKEVKLVDINGKFKKKG